GASVGPRRFGRCLPPSRRRGWAVRRRHSRSLDFEEEQVEADDLPLIALLAADLSERPFARTDVGAELAVDDDQVGGEEPGVLDGVLRADGGAVLEHFAVEFLDRGAAAAGVGLEGVGALLP